MHQLEKECRLKIFKGNPGQQTPRLEHESQLTWQSATKSAMNILSSNTSLESRTQSRGLGELLDSNSRSQKSAKGARVQADSNKSLDPVSENGFPSTEGKGSHVTKQLTLVPPKRESSAEGSSPATPRVTFRASEASKASFDAERKIDHHSRSKKHATGSSSQVINGMLRTVIARCVKMLLLTQ